MNVLKLIVSVLLLFGCNPSTNSIESKSFNSNASDLFFNTNVRDRYDNLVSYFKSVEGLKETESGWTVYPPLSALGQAESSITQETFEFQKYLELSSGFKDGILNIRKVGPDHDASAVLEINLEFKTKMDADIFYKKLVTDFSVLQLDKKETYLDNIQQTTFRENSSGSGLIITTFSLKEEELNSVTLRLVPGES